MKRVRDIQAPKVGRHVHVCTPAGAEVRGQVVERRLDRRGNVVYGLDNGSEFRPGLGDFLTFYSDHPKAPRHLGEGPDAARARIALSVAARHAQQRDTAIVAGIMFAIITTTAFAVLFVI